MEIQRKEEVLANEMIRKMHHEAGRRWVDLSTMAGDQDRDLQGAMMWSLK